MIKLIDLTHLIDQNTLNFEGYLGCQFKVVCDYYQCSSITKFKVHYLTISAGLGTHIDSPAHCFENAKAVNEIATEFLYETCIFDFEEYCRQSYAISLDCIMKKYVIQDIVFKNKLIIFKTGWYKHWGTKKYHNNYVFPYITKEVAEYFLNKGIAGIGIDTLSPDNITEGGYYPVHEILLSQNIFIIENIAHLDKIKQFNCQCIIAPLKIVSTESPIRLIAIMH